jgi:hypothetical protein
MDPSRSAFDNKVMMVASPAPPVFLGAHATRRLIADCAQIDCLLDSGRPSAQERLERSLGPMASRLVSALAGDHRMRERVLLA